MENNKYAMVDKSVFESIMQDCRNEALKVSDNLLEAHQIASMLYEGAVNPFDAMGIYKSGKHKKAATAKSDLSNLHSRITANIKAGKKPYTNLSKEEKLNVILSGTIDANNAKNAGSKLTLESSPVAVTTTKVTSNGIFDKWAKK